MVVIINGYSYHLSIFSEFRSFSYRVVFQTIMFKIIEIVTVEGYF